MLVTGFDEEVRDSSLLFSFVFVADREASSSREGREEVVSEVFSSFMFSVVAAGDGASLLVLGF